MSENAWLWKVCEPYGHWYRGEHSLERHVLMWKVVCHLIQFPTFIISKLEFLPNTYESMTPPYSGSFQPSQPHPVLLLYMGLLTTKQEGTHFVNKWDPSRCGRLFFCQQSGKKVHLC